MSENLAVRWMRRYKLFFLLGLLILGVQIFLAYKSLSITDLTTNRSVDTSTADLLTANAAIRNGKSQNIVAAGNQNSASDDEDLPANAKAQAANAKEQEQKSVDAVAEQTRGMSDVNVLTAEQLGFQPPCNVTAKEAISALQRAKTKTCREQIANTACAIQAGLFYAHHLPSYCPAGNHTANLSLGCYHDEKDARLLPGYFINYKTSNTPTRCIQLCLQSGYPYAGVQYSTECFCGHDAPSSAAKLADSSCNMKCSGDAKEICGGYFSMNVYETGIAKFTAQIAETRIAPGVQRVRIAFLLTLNGRALRQVHRLIRALYAPEHIFYIHVDARQHYLYRKLLELESDFENIRLARRRFSTIWGGASLLTMLMQCMEDLLTSTWQWDFVINLSESDFPVKRLDKLVEFLTANRGRNFVKSHGRETQRFIQKQGLDKTFVECDTHMWRIGDRQLPTGIQVDGGSDWVALSRSFVQYVTAEAPHSELLQGLLVIFRHTLLPAESFFHTVLRNSHFCDTYVDNNLHVTNWKRKLGCKCQYKHVVDWCGCSPNDFKPEDWSRLQNTEHKMLYFARKFEPIINQAVLLQLEQWLFGAYPADYPNLHSYWQSFYDDADRQHSGTAVDDTARTMGESLMRLAARQLHLQPQQLLELTHYLHQDQYKGFLLRYRAVSPNNDTVPLELESRVRPVQYVKLAKNSKFAKRLRGFEVASDFDQKEQVSRNLAKLLGPYTEPVLSFTFIGAGAESSAHSYNLTLLWIDPTGRLQDFNELHIEDAQTDAINFSKALLKQPLMPGIWTAKLIGRSAIYAQTKFLVTPLTIHAGEPITHERARKINTGSGFSLPADFAVPTEWRQHLLSATDMETLRKLASANAQRVDDALTDWVDGLVSKFFHLRESCAVNEAAMQVSSPTLHTLPLCRHTPWSSLAPDPKSDVRSLLKFS